MKKMILMMLVMSITGTAMSQTQTATTTAEMTFEMPEEFILKRYFIDLGKGNTMRIEVSNINDILQFKNIDSIITVFFNDMALFKDSLSDPATARRIDYVTDRNGRKKIRITKSNTGSSSYLLRGSEVSILKTEQDSIHIIGIVNKPAAATLHKPFSDVRYYRLSFFVNDIEDLHELKTADLGAKLSAIADTRDARWTRDKEGDWHIVKSDKTISAKNAGGFVQRSSDYIASHLSASIANYKNVFVPSFSLGIDVVYNNRKQKRTFGLYCEPSYVFVQSAGGNNKTYRNDFYTFSYRQENVKAYSDIFHIEPSFSLSYLKKQKGNVFDDNSFRLGTGQFSLFGEKVKIEPGIYFTDFFKKVTPSVKLSVNF